MRKENIIYVGIDLHKETHTAVMLDCWNQKLGIQYEVLPCGEVDLNEIYINEDLVEEVAHDLNFVLVDAVNGFVGTPKPDSRPLTEAEIQKMNE